MMHRVTVLPRNQNIDAKAGENLRTVLLRGGLGVDAPCGGKGSCGKCKVRIDGEEVLACRISVDRDMTVTLPAAEKVAILEEGIAPAAVAGSETGLCLAFDVGTTTVVGFLLDGASGQELACDSMLNPQIAFGADVISRIQYAANGNLSQLTEAIRRCVSTLAVNLCEKAGAALEEVTTICIVGNPAMQQFFMGILPDNLARIPFAPVLTEAKISRAEEYLPICPNAQFLIVPDVSGFVGADTLAAVLATGLHEREELTLLVDIGTNGEMVLGNRHRMVACSAAAGPALEGANIRFGMRGQPGAIDHVWLEKGEIRCSILGGGKAVGICGSGLIDALAAALDAELLNERGNIRTEDRTIRLQEGVYLTQEDIRQVQLAKGAIAAGIALMAEYLDMELKEIQQVYLAGAFGTYMNPDSACRIGLLPLALADRITPVGNAAGSGAKILACHDGGRELAQNLVGRIDFLELASLPGFRRSFAKNMRFWDGENYWCQKAMALGFANAVPLDVNTLRPRQDVRDMCAADKCCAYGKNWTCPPLCGELDQCSAEMSLYTRGVLLQTVGNLEKTIDTKAYRRTEAMHLEQFYKFCEQIRKIYPKALCLGSGGCRVCGKCAWPEPCRFPEKACSSMEAYGLFVTQICRDNGCCYHYGEKTITYMACVLF